MTAAQVRFPLPVCACAGQAKAASWPASQVWFGWKLEHALLQMPRLMDGGVVKLEWKGTPHWNDFPGQDFRCRLLRSAREEP